MFMLRKSARIVSLRFYCSGGCAANSYNFHGDIHNAYDIGCALQKKRVECAIMIKAAEAFEEVKATLHQRQTFTVWLRKKVIQVAICFARRTFMQNHELLVTE